MEQDPLNDPQLAETFAAFGQLLAAAESPLDERALTARVTARWNRQVRRRRLRYAAGALAAAASLLVSVGIIRMKQPAEEAVAVATIPPPAAQEVAPGPTPPETAEPSPLEFEVADWDDELATETAALATAARLTEERWRDLPDGLTLLKARADTLEDEITNGSL